MIDRDQALREMGLWPRWRRRTSARETSAGHASAGETLSSATLAGETAAIEIAAGGTAAGEAITGRTLAGDVRPPGMADEAAFEGVSPAPSSTNLPDEQRARRISAMDWEALIADIAACTASGVNSGLRLLKPPGNRFVSTGASLNPALRRWD